MPYLFRKRSCLLPRGVQQGAMAALLLLGLGTAASSALARKQTPPAPGNPVAVASPTAMPGPAFTSPESAAQVNAACDLGLAEAKSRVAQLEKRKADLGWLAAYDDLNGLTEDAYYPLSFIGNVHPEKGVRDAAQGCDLKWQDFSSSLGQNEVLFKLLKSVKTKDAIDETFKRVSLEGFEDAGVALSPTKRARAKVILDRITALSLDFDKNIRDNNTKVAFTEADLKGVPADVISGAKRDAAGVLLMGLDSPTYTPIVQYAESGAARERIWRAKQNEGGDANLRLLGEIVKLRKEYAQLFGFGSYGEFVLRRRMVQSTTRANKFMDDLRGVIEEGERREITELRNAKAFHLNDGGAKLERWDVSFYNERIKRERYTIDQNLFRQYFPPQESLMFVMGIAERMFGVKYVKVNAKLWHPEAQAFAVVDATTGKSLAGLMVDLYPRDGKYNHAAVWSVRGSSSRDHRAPRAALVVNFDRKGLTLDELETLLHEFGHALHNNLSATRYSSQAGTSTLRDFVEAPSQMLEDWVYDPKVLATFKNVCAACKPVPPELLAQAIKARDHGKATRYARQHLYATYDLALHGATAPEPMAAWSSMEGATPLGTVQGTKFPAGFGHIAGGYAAGYYGYLWSEVVARDMRTTFGNDKLSPVLGARYRSAVLANGGQRPPQALVRQFMGRDSNAKAFYDYLKQP